MVTQMDMKPKTQARARFIHRYYGQSSRVRNAGQQCDDYHPRKEAFPHLEWIQTEPFNIAKVEFLPEFIKGDDDAEFPILMDSIKDIATKLIQESPHIPSEAQAALDNIRSNTFLLNFIASNSSMKLPKKQEVLELESLKDRAVKVLEGLNLELKMLEVKNEIHDKVKHNLTSSSANIFAPADAYYPEELGGNSSESEVEEMREKSKAKKWDKASEEHFNKELHKLQRLNPQMPGLPYSATIWNSCLSFRLLVWIQGQLI